MKKKVQLWVFGFIVGVIIGGWFGVNFGRDVPLLSNPFAAPEVKERVTEKMKQGAEQAVESTKKGAEKALEQAKEKIHEATKPAEQKAQ